jgi:pantoate--beta-alanine ligase
VATVVVKLLNIVRPDAAFFGQKDFQQTVVIRRLAEDLNLGVRVIVCPTVRDPDGVALSSRNEYLSAKQRRTAAVLYRALKAGAASIQQGERSAAQVRRVMLAVARREPLARVDYLVACDPRTLEPLVQIVRPAVLLGAIRIGRVRLIDNILIDS